MTLKIASLTILLLVACSPANAQQHDGARMIAQLEKADANHDGAVSRQEFTAFRASQFTRLDRNHDGFFTDNDIPAFAKSRIPPELWVDTLKASFDSNNDGKVSQTEFVNGPSLMFERVDANQDGLVTEAELNTARAALAARR